MAETKTLPEAAQVETPAATPPATDVKPHKRASWLGGLDFFGGNHDKTETPVSTLASESTQTPSPTDTSIGALDKPLDPAVEQGSENPQVRMVSEEVTDSNNSTGEAPTIGDTADAITSDPVVESADAEATADEAEALKKITEEAKVIDSGAESGSADTNESKDLTAQEGQEDNSDGEQRTYETPISTLGSESTQTPSPTDSSMGAFDKSLDSAQDTSEDKGDGTTSDAPVVAGEDASFSGDDSSHEVTDPTFVAEGEGASDSDESKDQPRPFEPEEGLTPTGEGEDTSKTEEDDHTDESQSTDSEKPEGESDDADEHEDADKHDETSDDSHEDDHTEQQADVDDKDKETDDEDSTESSDTGYTTYKDSRTPIDSPASEEEDDTTDTDKSQDRQPEPTDDSEASLDTSSDTESEPEDKKTEISAEQAAENYDLFLMRLLDAKIDVKSAEGLRNAAKANPEQLPEFIKTLDAMEAIATETADSYAKHDRADIKDKAQAMDEVTEEFLNAYSKEDASEADKQKAELLKLYKEDLKKVDVKLVG